MKTSFGWKRKLLRRREEEGETCMTFHTVISQSRGGKRCESWEVLITQFCDKQMKLKVDVWEQSEKSIIGFLRCT